MRALVAGWFSFEDMGATAGDLMARDVACAWLEEAAIPYDVACVPPFEGTVEWRSADPEAYTHVVFVCGPFGNGPPVTEFLERFGGRTLIGLDLTMMEAIADWNPFDLLIERDSPTTARPDLSFLAPSTRLPLVGIVEVHDQNVPGARHDQVRQAIDRLWSSETFVPLAIDTRLDVDNAGRLRTPAQIESLIARMDAVVTMRMHGLALALKNGVPAVALDPIAGGHKVTRQAAALGWDLVIAADELTDAKLDDALARCLTAEAAERAARCAAKARAQLQDARSTFVGFLSGSTS